MCCIIINLLVHSSPFINFCFTTFITGDLSFEQFQTTSNLECKVLRRQKYFSQFYNVFAKKLSTTNMCLGMVSLNFWKLNITEGDWYFHSLIRNKVENWYKVQKTVWTYQKRMSKNVQISKNCEFQFLREDFQ